MLWMGKVLKAERFVIPGLPYPPKVGMSMSQKADELWEGLKQLLLVAADAGGSPEAGSV